MTKLEKEFTKKLQTDIRLQYKIMGSKMRNMARVFDDNDEPCPMDDCYAGDWIDSLDEMKANVEVCETQAMAMAYALGRKSDELIVGALDTVINNAGDKSDGLTRCKIDEALDTLYMADYDNHKYAIVGWKQWSDLLGINDFANADYVEDSELPWRGTQAKRWKSVLWIPHSSLTKEGNVRRCHLFNHSAVAHKAGPDVKTDITWHGDRAAHFVNNLMEQGATIVEPSGVVSMRCLED